MKKLSAVLCTVVMLFCTSCDSGLQELQAPKSIDDMKIEIKDSQVQAYLSETFQIDADLTGADISKLPSYNLYAPRISNDKIAEIFMPGGGYKIEDKEDGTVEYTKDKEKLVIKIDEKTDEPYIKYYLDKDKGKAYEVVPNTSIENLSVEATETAAADLVKEKLDMLSVEYSDLKLQKLNFTEMNERYTAVVKREQSYQRNEYDTTPTEEPLDEHFKFTAEDDCYVITGTMILKGLPVYHPIITNDVITNISTGTTPNVCISYPDHIATYLTGDNVVVPLDELLVDERYGLGGSEMKFDSPTKDEIVPQFLKECAIDGVYYAIPYMRSSEACYINKTYVEALGYEVPEVLTWDFVFEVSEAAMAKNEDGTFKINNQNVMIPFIYKSTDNMMIQMLKQKGAGYSKEDGTIEIFNDTTKEILKTVAEHAKTRAFSTFKIDSYPANFLNAGQCIFAIDSTAGATWMGSEAPLSDIAEDQIVDFETVVRTVPQYDPEHPAMISQGPSICIFNKADQQEVLASWLFAQYLLTNEVQIAYAETEGYVPVTTKAQQDPSYQDYLSRAGEDNSLYYDIKIQASELIMENTEYTFTTPVFNGSASLRDAAGQMIENTCKAVRRGQTVDDAYYDNLYEEVIKLYRLTFNFHFQTAGCFIDKVNCLIR